MRITFIVIFALIFFSQSLICQLLITEFLADPEDPLGSEWIEVYNFSDQALNLDGWSLCDLVGCANLDSSLIEPGNYFVLCQDSADFRSYYEDFDRILIQVSSWRALNNSGDLILLLTPDSIVADSVPYSSTNGGNISWERISFDDPGWESSNWHPSLDITGSTPGRVNSVYGGFPSGFKLSLVSKLISPGCGYEHEYLKIKIEIPRECYLTLDVYSLEGHKLLTIFDEQMLASGEYTYDGRTSDGKYLEVGMY
ncbi:MAG: lamin tail domain-containing protein, partial [candidate division Zixibacteria bacterium]|nr:lamin tail domain-containing protein [candidate division Zixibacteria bacterium]NIR66967.1 lamin tail domain-containing protein [candidate division Zixibacteria bacterium]NIS15471.1 lamin tail domain-containing protein [candidate division Zixibacteria bacterium]NIS48417.1 lamin tail domain-containing protein [candidate division Zixibacteria bacterium]NIT51986.1 lamin tail domain-containing protein [candidate division Zixibacteria bacterium]